MAITAAHSLPTETRTRNVEGNMAGMADSRAGDDDGHADTDIGLREEGGMDG